MLGTRHFLFFFSFAQGIFFPFVALEMMNRQYLRNKKHGWVSSNSTAMALGEWGGGGGEGVQLWQCLSWGVSSLAGRLSWEVQRYFEKSGSNWHLAGSQGLGSAPSPLHNCSHAWCGKRKPVFLLMRMHCGLLPASLYFFSRYYQLLTSTAVSLDLPAFTIAASGQ